MFVRIETTQVRYDGEQHAESKTMEIFATMAVADLLEAVRRRRRTQPRDPPR